MHSSPVFSIVIPTYNRAHLIGKTIQSLLEQTFPDFELIVSDDGSTDHTEALIKNINDPRIRYYRKNNGGVSSARNYGINFCKGEFINFFDSDDLAYPNHLQEAYSFIQAKPEAEIILFDFEWGDSEKKDVKEVLMRYKEPNKAILKLNYPSTNCVFLHKRIFETMRFNEALTIAEDWEFWLRNSIRHTFHLGKIKTSYFVDHQERSVRKFNLVNLLNQKLILINSLKNDPEFYKKHGSRLPFIDAHMSSYIAIHGAIEGKKASVIRLFLKSLVLDPKSIFTNRSMAIIKHLLFTW